MGLCFSKKVPPRLLLIGLDCAGKTCLLYRLVLNQTIPTVPTIGFNAEKVSIGSKTSYVWDVGGQVKLRTLWDKYTQDVNGVIFVVDASDRSRLNEARDELYRIMSVPDLDPSRPLLIMANKQDLPGAMNSDELMKAWGWDSSAVSYESPSASGQRNEEQARLTSSHVDYRSSNLPAPFIGRKVYIQGCCAITAEGTEEGFSWILAQLGH
eukprot:507510_1